MGRGTVQGQQAVSVTYPAEKMPCIPYPPLAFLTFAGQVTEGSYTLSEM